MVIRLRKVLVALLWFQNLAKLYYPFLQKNSSLSYVKTLYCFKMKNFDFQVHLSEKSLSGKGKGLPKRNLRFDLDFKHLSSTEKVLWECT